jgi:hypothetical protein
MNDNDKTAMRGDGDSNPDPITGAPGSHPVGTGAGALAAGTAGAAIGTAMGGPVGGIVGAAVGAIAGGLGGKAAGEAIDPTAEDAYWRENHASQPFAADSTYEDYEPAYRAGYSGFAAKGPNATFEQAEPDLRAEYEAAKPRLPWDKTRAASRAAWTRLQQSAASRRPTE